MPSKVSIINSCVETASLNFPIVGTNTYPTDHPWIIGMPTVLPANRPTISSASNPTKQVPRPLKNTEGGTAFSFSESLPTAAELYQITPQDKDTTYKAEAPGENILFVMLQPYWFDEKAWAGSSRVSKILSDSHTDFAAMILNVPKLRQVDFSSVKDPRYNYPDQTHINKRRVWLLTALAVYYNLDFGLVVRYLAGKYMAK